MERKLVLSYVCFCFALYQISSVIHSLAQGVDVMQSEKCAEFVFWRDNLHSDFHHSIFVLGVELGIG